MAPPRRDPDRVLMHLYLALYAGFGAALLLDTFVLAAASLDQRKLAAVLACAALALFCAAALWWERS